MKKVFKIGLVIFFTGLILGVIGWFTGGGMSTVNKLYIYDHMRLGFSDEQRSVNTQTDEFDNIQNNADNYALRVDRGDKYSVKISSNGDRMPNYKIENKTLMFDKKDNSEGRFFIHNYNAPLIIVTVPKDKTLNNVSMNVPSENQMGSFRARNVKINRANIKLNDGNIYFENSTLNQKINLSTNNGEVKMQNTNLLNGGIIKTPQDLLFDAGKVKGQLKIDNSNMNTDDFYDDDDYLNTQSIKNVGKLRYELKSSHHGHNYVDGDKRSGKVVLNKNVKDSIILNNYYGNNHLTTK